MGRRGSDGSEILGKIVIFIICFILGFAFPPLWAVATALFAYFEHKK